MKFVSCFQYVDRFLRYSSTVVLNPTEFWTFFVLPNFKKAVTPMLYISDNDHLMARPVAKFYGVTPLTPKL